MSDKKKLLLTLDSTWAAGAATGVTVQTGAGTTNTLLVAFAEYNGDLYIADRGRSHQIKVFTAVGGPLRTIGKPGAPQAARPVAQGSGIGDQTASVLARSELALGSWELEVGSWSRSSRS